MLRSVPGLVASAVLVVIGGRAAAQDALPAVRVFVDDEDTIRSEGLPALSENGARIYALTILDGEATLVTTDAATGRTIASFTVGVASCADDGCAAARRRATRATRRVRGATPLVAATPRPVVTFTPTEPSDGCVGVLTLVTPWGTFEEAGQLRSDYASRCFRACEVRVGTPGWERWEVYPDLAHGRVLCRVDLTGMDGCITPHESRDVPIWLTFLVSSYMP